jgi:hypothetical protein
MRDFQEKIQKQEIMLNNYMNIYRHIGGDCVAIYYWRRKGRIR